jgi:hypothetical protein
LSSGQGGKPHAGRQSLPAAQDRRKGFRLVPTTVGPAVPSSRISSRSRAGFGSCSCSRACSGCCLEHARLVASGVVPDGPSDSGEIVGESDGGLVVAASGLDAERPGDDAVGLWLLLRRPEDGVRSVNQELARGGAAPSTATTARSTFRRTGVFSTTDSSFRPGALMSDSARHWHSVPTQSRRAEAIPVLEWTTGLGPVAAQLMIR